MKLYADYIKERDNQQLILLPNDIGFYTIKTESNNCLICDAYVKPEFRKKGIMKQVVNDLAKTYENVFTMSCTNSTCWLESHKAILARGFRVIDKKDSLIYYILEK